MGTSDRSPAVLRSAEILCVGTELLLGDIVNTDAAFLARRLAELGISVYRQTVVGDNAARLTQALSDAFSGQGRPAADLVVLCGGLGPTCDDLTKETVAAFFGRRLLLHEPSLRRIRAFFARAGRDMSPNNGKQAMMPEGAVVFPNDNGTAPALALSDGRRTAVLLPGPPAELEPIFDERVAPFLRARSEGIIVSRNLYLMGPSEASVGEILRDLTASSQNPTIASYCQAGEVRLRVTASARTRDEADALCEGMIRTVLGTPLADAVYGVDVGNVETALARALTARSLTLSAAESCTGGLVAKRLTDVPGASRVFAGGCVAYTNEAKTRLLEVPAALIAARTAVSAEVAAAMAEGARRTFGTDLAVSTTGYAGPGGGDAENPVGTVYLGVASELGTETLRLSLGSGRSRAVVREIAAGRALREALRAAARLP